MSKLFQISEDDLAALERDLPAILETTYPACNDPLTCKRWEEVRRIVADVRWNYGPPSDVSQIEA